MIQIFKDTKYDFIGIRKYAYIISSSLIIAGIISMITKGMKYGIDFTGGSLVELHFDAPIKVMEIRTQISKIGLGDATIQEIKNTQYNFLIKTKPKEGIGKDILNLFAKENNPNIPRIEREELVGPSISADFRKKAFWVVLLGFVIILIYVWIRFTFRWGVCAIIALIHDVLVTLAFLSFFNKEITISIIAGLLTIIGYSINDTIVVSDRVRENLRLFHRKYNLKEIINISVNQTLSRTILTSLTTFFVVLILFFVGGKVIHDFAFTLLVGIITGTYSTVYIVSALIVEWENFFPSKR